MKRTKENKERSWLPLDSFLVCLLAVIVLVTGMTASSYTTTAEAEDTAQVAAFSVTDSLGEATISLGGMSPGSKKEFTFTIQNDSDVAVACRVKLTSTGNLPLTYSISDGSASQLMTLDQEVTMPSLKPHDSTVTYTITATWPAADNAFKYADLTDAVKLSVTTDQID